MSSDRSMVDESQYSESGGNKRKYEDEAPRRRATGFSSPISAPRSYNSVAPPLEGIELAKHKAQEVAVRLAAAAAEDAKHARFDDGSGGFDNGRGFSSAPSVHMVTTMVRAKRWMFHNRGLVLSLVGVGKLSIIFNCNLEQRFRSREMGMQTLVLLPGL